MLTSEPGVVNVFEPVLGSNWIVQPSQRNELTCWREIAETKLTYSRTQEMITLKHKSKEAHTSREI